MVGIALVGRHGLKAGYLNTQCLLFELVPAFREGRLMFAFSPFHMKGSPIMTQAELNHAVARTTGETVSTIAAMGFVPLTPIPIEREPTFVDWDELDAHRGAVFPQRRRQRLALA